jgi:hypothetical protein
MKMMQTVRAGVVAILGLGLGACAGAHIGPKTGYVDQRPQGATNGPGNRYPGTPGSGLNDAGINTGSGEGANPVR